MSDARPLNPHAKRAAIMFAAEQLFASCGFAKTTMAQIATKADVAVGSVYRAFPDKLALLTALHEMMEKKFIDTILDNWDFEQPADVRFRHMTTAIMNKTAEVKASMPLYMLTRDLVSSGGQEPGERTRAVIAGLFEAGTERGELVAIPSSMAAAIGYGIVEGGMRDWMAGGAHAAALPVAVDILTGCFVRAFVIDGTLQN